MENNENNIQNEVKNVENNVNSAQNNMPKKEKGKMIALMVIVLLLVLAVGVLAGVMISGKNKPEFVRQIENKVTNKEDEKESKKIDESKDWVYDAEYKKENKKIYQDSAKTEEYASNSDKDLVVPYINIDSDYAKKINDNIKALYDEYYAKYGTSLTTPFSDEYKCYNRYELKYDKFLNDNILSVIITLHEGAVVVDGGTGGGTFTKYTYNFNLDTLNEASLDEMAKKCGFESENEVKEKVENWEKRQEELKKKYADYIAATMEGVQKGKYFIDANHKLNFIFRSQAASTCDNAQPIEKNKNIEDFYIEKELIEQQEIYENSLANNQIIDKNENTSTNSYAKEYIKIIDEVAAEYPDSNLTCDLIYFNNDDIPDLVIGISGYWVSLYVYENGTVYNPIDNWAYGAMGNTGYAYLEKKGAIFNYNSDYAGGILTTSIAKYNSKHDFDYLAHRDKGADIDSTDSMYEEIQKDLEKTGGYYYNDQKLSEQEFNNKVKELSVSTDVRDYKTLDGSKTTEEVKNQLRK